MSQLSKTFFLDGSLLEGGGQILRNAVALAALKRERIVIEKIRAGRSRPGLAMQHMTGIQLVKSLIGAQTQGLDKGSTKLEFDATSGVPSSLFEFTADTQTAGSVCLLAQVALPVMLFHPHATQCSLRGGTNASFAPQLDYLQLVFAPIARRLLGLDFDVQISRRGFYPKGGGKVMLSCNSPIAPQTSLASFQLLERGKVVKIGGISIVGGRLPAHIADRQLKGATKHLRSYFRGQNVSIEIDIDVHGAAQGPGNAIVLTATTETGCIIGGSALGSRNVRAEDIGIAAANDLIKQLEGGGCVDEHLQDQLIVLMALADGESAVRTGPIEMHTKTAMHFAEILTDATFRVESVPDSEQHIIWCKGCAFKTQ